MTTRWAFLHAPFKYNKLRACSWISIKWLSMKQSSSITSQLNHFVNRKETLLLNGQLISSCHLSFPEGLPLHRASTVHQLLFIFERYLYHLLFQPSTTSQRVFLRLFKLFAITYSNACLSSGPKGSQEFSVSMAKGFWGVCRLFAFFSTISHCSKNRECSS